MADFFKIFLDDKIKLNILLVFINYIILISNIFSKNYKAEMAHWLFIIYFIFVILAKYLNKEISFYLLLTLTFMIFIFQMLY